MATAVLSLGAKELEVAEQQAAQAEERADLALEEAQWARQDAVDETEGRLP